MSDCTGRCLNLFGNAHKLLRPAGLRKWLSPFAVERMQVVAFPRLHTDHVARHRFIVQTEQLSKYHFTSFQRLLSDDSIMLFERLTISTAVRSSSLLLPCVQRRFAPLETSLGGSRGSIAIVILFIPVQVDFDTLSITSIKLSLLQIYAELASRLRRELRREVSCHSVFVTGYPVLEASATCADIFAWLKVL